MTEINDDEDSFSMKGKKDTFSMDDIVEGREAAAELGPTADGTYTDAKGGTEMMNEQLYARVDNDLLDQFHIIKSRVRHVDPDKKNILWLHDTWDDPESQHLEDAEQRKRFAKLVFVSNYQFQTYHLAHGVPFSESFVLRNAIDPIPWKEKGKDQIRLIYHTTPHRGLNIAVASILELAKVYGDKIHFDVFSSFNAYGWPDADQPYLKMFDQIREHPNMTYHGYQPNDVVREALQEAHIYAYPNVWPETSCISVIEAMSAGCQVVCPNYGALPETTGHFATSYQFNEDINTHANIFVNILKAAIDAHNSEDMRRKLMFQKQWTDNFYNWDMRAAEWTGLLQGILKNG